MSAPPAENDPVHATESSSGYSDGLGTRVLGFDRESGGMLERLVLRPELTVFEAMLGQRLAMVAALEDERFAKPRAIERDADDRLVIVSDYVAGRRLSDIIDAAADHGIVAGLDAGIGLLLELLPAIARIHDAGLVLGTLAPGRIVITSTGQVVLLDAIYGEPLERLQLTRKRLWSEFRLAFPPTAGLARFDKSADLAHASIVAATLTVGRPLQDSDYPDGIASLRREVHEIASIRGSKTFADSMNKFFGTTLPLAGRKNTPASADEAAIDLRKLVRKDLGINTCRDALLEFLLQVETADAERIAVDLSAREEAARKAREEADRIAREEAERKARKEAERKAREEAERKAREEAERKAREEADRKAREEALRKALEEAERKTREEAQRKAREEAERKARQQAERKAREEAERKAREEAERKAREEAERKAREEAERKAREEAERKAREEAERKAREEAERKAREEAERKAREEFERKAREEAERKAREEAERKAREEAERKAREEAERKAREEAERKAREEAERKAREEAERKAREEAERKAREEAERKAREEAERKAREEAERKAREEAERKAREEAERKARDEAERQAREEVARRAREEAERKAREEDQRKAKEEAERAAAEASRKRGGWLISPENATKFEPPVPADTPPPAPPAMPAAKPYPIYVAPSDPAPFNANLPPTAPPITDLIPSLAGGGASSPSGAIPLAPSSPLGGIRVKLDSETPAPTRGEQRNEPLNDVVSAAEAYGYTPPKERQPIPWKLIAAGAVLIAATFGITEYGPSAGPVVDTVKKVIPKTAPAPAVPTTPVGANVGRVILTTQPAGAKVQLDGKDAGETPLTLENVRPGRHTLTITGTDGVAKRTIRVESGKALELDVALYPGFVAVSAPIVVTVAENGKVIGTSENQIILPPGRHDLRLTNKELGYSASESVDVASGEVARINLDPMGRANINAAPWAEVWVDGVKIGDTPLANVAIRLGVREIVFKNAQYPDRKQTVTIVGGPAATISVDFNK